MLLLLFNQANATITGTLAVTEAQDVVAFSGDFPIFASFAVTDLPDTVSMSGTFVRLGWNPAIIQSEAWATARQQQETWTPAVKQAEVWTAE